MAVPVGGNFSMFGATGTAIAGAIVEGGANFNTVDAVNNFNDLKALANIDKFDPLYSNGATTLGNIVETVQFRGYPVLTCDSATAFSGSQAYPNSQTVVLGAGLGDVQLSFNAQSVPDRFIVFYNSVVVIDTGYRGTSGFDFGGGSRLSFTNSLAGKIDPILTTTYPDVINFPDDGFPRVVSPGSGTSSFSKGTASPTTAQIDTYAPVASTAYSYTLGCPTAPPAETVTLNFFNSLVKDDPGLQAESVLLVTRPSNTVINNTTSTTSTGNVTTETEVLHTINVSAIGESGVITEGALITLSITGGVNPPGDPFVVTSTTGFLTASYTFINDLSGYILDAEVAISAPEE